MVTRRGTSGTIQQTVSTIPSPRSGDRPASGRRYAAVARALEGEIRGGALADAAHLPSERVLVERFRVSRVTVRRALRELEADGLVLAAPGRGWLVRGGRLEEPENELMPFSAAAAARGLRPTSRVLVARSREATFEEAEALAVVPGSTVFELERVRLLDGLPVAIDWCLIPGGRGGDMERPDWRSASLYEALGAAGGAPMRADYVVRADGADAREAHHLDLVAGAPVLRADQVSFDAAGRPVQLCRIAYRGDRYRFRASLGRRP